MDLPPRVFLVASAVIVTHATIRISTAITGHIAAVVVVAYAAVCIALAEAGHVATIVIVTYTAISIALAKSGHIASAVIVAGNTVCTALTKTSAHRCSPFFRIWNLISYDGAVKTGGELVRLRFVKASP